MRLQVLLRCLRRQLHSHNSHTFRTHSCGDLRIVDAGSKVTIAGWLAFRRLNRFIVIRDAYGSIQATVRVGDSETEEILPRIPYESVVSVHGLVKDRGLQRNPKMATGDIEIEIESLSVLNECRRDLPVLPDSNANEKTRLRFRYLDLRSQQLQANLRLRSDFVHAARRFLVEQKAFVDVETPTLFRRTPGGAAEFIVPSRLPHRGLAYSLPQSPQQFKQLLMIGGIDRYFQVARCYRDEGSKLDRQPEFTQIDLELSFTTQRQLTDLLEEMLVSAWPPHLAHLCPPRPFPRLSYKEVMRDYGMDKPDLRLPWKIEEEKTSLFSPLKGKNSEGEWMLGVIKAPGTGSAASKVAAKHWKILIDGNANKGPFIVLSKMTKKQKSQNSWFNFVTDGRVFEHFAADEEKDAVILAWGPPSSVRWTLGQLRNLLGDAAGLRGPGSFSALWVEGFPLFERDENGRLASCHHPFTAPVPQDEEKLRRGEDLDNLQAQHFDLVLNGMELGGGSMRIHSGTLQRKVLKLLGEEAKEMSHLLDALGSGAPPHGGFAFGLDRVISLLAGRGDSSYGIRDVIAFPKTKEGRDLMVDTPIEPSEEELRRYGFRIAEDVSKGREESTP